MLRSSILINSTVKFWISFLALPVLYILAISALDMILIRPLDNENIPGLFWVLLRVAILHIVLAFWLRIFYREHYATVLGKNASQWRKALGMAQFFAALTFLGSEPIFLALNWSEIGFQWQADWKHWAIWFLPLLVMIFLQTSAEEFFFRGFLQSKMKALGAKRWVYIVIPAFLWACIHQAMFKEIEFKIAVVAQMFVLGLILGDWVERSGSLWGAIFVHFILNSFTMLIYGNTLRPTDFYILQADFSALSQGTQIFYFALAGLSMLAAYMLVIRKRLGGAYDSQ